MNTLQRWGAWSRRRARAVGMLPAQRERITTGTAARRSAARRSGGGGLFGGRLSFLRRRTVVDPFCALEVQLALARVEREIEQLGVPDGRFARGHHLVAARLAYDQLLAEACRLAGIEQSADEPNGPGCPDDPDRSTPPGLRRLLAEVELRSRGWAW